MGKRKISWGERGQTESKSASAGRESAAEEKEEMEKKLYVFVWHGGISDYGHSLYALDIPRPGSIINTTKTTTTTTTTTTTATSPTVTSVDRIEVERFQVDPVLRFSSDEWQQIMTCVRLDRKLYFLGGRSRRKDITYPLSVFSLDLSSLNQQKISNFRDLPLGLLEPGPCMRTGKSNPLISFVADGKIFVVSGIKHCRYTNKELQQFEIFDPANQKWDVGERPPPFDDASVLGSPLIVNRMVYFGGCSSKKGEFVCRYDLDSRKWSKGLRTRVGSSSFDFKLDNFKFEIRDSKTDPKFGGQIVGETLWNICFDTETGAPVAVPFDINMNMEQKKKNKLSNVIKYYIQSSNLESAVLTPACVDGDCHLCYLQAGYPEDLLKQDRCISVTLFNVRGKGDSATYLSSGHYVVETGGRPFYVVAAHVV